MSTSREEPAPGPAPAEPVLGEPPVLAFDPVIGADDVASVRVVGTSTGTTAVPVSRTSSGGASALGAATDGAQGPVPALDPLQSAAVLAVAPTHRRGRRRRTLLVVSALLAVAGIGLVVLAVARDGAVPTAHGAAPPMRLGTPILSARRAPSLLTRPMALRAVRAATAPVVARFPNASCVLVTDGPDTLADAASTTPLAPASNTKLLTASAALSVLGSDSRFSTKVLTPAPPSAGRVAGDLYLVGGGDPLLSTGTAAALMRHGQEPTTSLETLADQVVAAGIRTVDGSVVGDGSRYDDQRKVPTWPDRFTSTGIVANLGALMVNDAWSIDPIDAKRGGGAAASDPATAAAAAFTALLQARGVQVGGAARSGKAPAGATEVTSIPSLPIKDVVGQMLTFSDNTTAELLVKEMAVHAGAPGTTDDGIRVLVANLAERGLPTEGLELHDGSGLSRENRVTCRLLDSILAADGPGGTIAQRLARPGGSGTLDDRFTTGPLKDRIAAKTGTLNDVTALSGWLTTSSGRPLAFSILENPVGRATQASDLALQGQLLEALLSYPQSPPAEQLRPLPPTAT